MAAEGEGRELEDGELPLMGGNFHSHVADPQHDVDLLSGVDPQSVSGLQHGADLPYGVAHRHGEPQRSCGGMVLQKVWMVCGDAYPPSELDSRLMLASLSRVHPPIRAISLDRLKAVDHHCVPQRRLQLQLEQMQEQERHPQFLQGSRYLDDGTGEGNRTLAMGFCCP